MSLLLLLLFTLFPLSVSSSSSFLAPIAKDHSTHLYRVSIYLKTPPQPTNLLLDLGSSFTWVDCTQNYTSSTYRSIPCNSSLCNALGSNACSNCFNPPGPGCSNDSCALFPENSVTRRAEISQAIVDSLSLPATDGRNPGPARSASDFVFSCDKTSLLEGLKELFVTGSAGLGRSNLSLPAQVSTAFSTPYLFALCLSGSPSAPGVAFFGGGPYYFFPEIDLGKTFIYTPLLTNPVGNTVITYTHPSDEYFIGLTSIKVNGKPLPFDQTLLAIDQRGYGGTKISTVVPYTRLHASIYRALIDAFVNESAALNLTVTEPVKPFEVCYSADDVLNTRVGPGVPTVDLVLQSDDVFWRMFGSNSMVRIARHDVDVWCLAFVDGGTQPRTSVVIGGHQMEDNLLEFDVGLKRLGFSASVLLHNTTCSNFNFTTNIALKWLDPRVQSTITLCQWVHTRQLSLSNRLLLHIL